MIVSKELALEEVAVMVSEQAAILDSLTPRQAAERAWTPGGPSLEELEQWAAERLENRRRRRAASLA